MHTLIAVLIQAFSVILGLGPIVGAAAAIFYFIGREYAQAEYRYIEQYCQGHRANMPALAGFYPKAWTKKGLLDFIVPSTVVIILALV